MTGATSCMPACLRILEDAHNLLIGDPVNALPFLVAAVILSRSEHSNPKTTAALEENKHPAKHHRY